MKINNQIIYYDLNNIYYSSFYLTGLLQNTEKFNYKFIISKTAPPLLLDPETVKANKFYKICICLFRARLFNKEFYFCIDTRDSCKAYHLPLLKKVKYYFKVNYNADAISSDPNLRTFDNKIISILPFYPIKMPRLLHFLPRIFPSSSTGWTMRDAIGRFKHLNSLLTLDQIRQIRNLKKELDIFFVTTFYGQKHSAEREFRYQIMKEIQKHHDITSVVGFASRRKIPGKFTEFQLKGFSLKKYLSYIAKSKIAIYVRGLHNCLSFKFAQLLSLGMPIVGQTIPNNKRILYNNKYFNEQFVFDDPKDIVKKAIELLDKPEKLITLGKSNARVFDTKFTPQAVISDILERLIT